MVRTRNVAKREELETIVKPLSGKNKTIVKQKGDVLGKASKTFVPFREHLLDSLYALHSGHSIRQKRASWATAQRRSSGRAMLGSCSRWRCSCSAEPLMRSARADGEIQHSVFGRFDFLPKPMVENYNVDQCKDKL